MDGNNSMKRVDGSGHADERTFSSNYHLPPPQVDRFKDDVKTRPGTKAHATQAGASNEALPFGDEKTICTDNWMAANSVSNELITVFQQTGGFVCACRHGIIETFVEMRKSGEL
jgi:hypothetical protein